MVRTWGLRECESVVAWERKWVREWDQRMGERVWCDSVRMG